jgi:hypothetical protein
MSIRSEHAGCEEVVDCVGEQVITDVDVRRVIGEAVGSAGVVQLRSAVVVEVQRPERTS